ncbi:MAG: class I SAM-dependent RNA methyltransferase [Oscillospiraceae bacterium]
MEYDFIAPCYFGTESSAVFDVKRIGATDINITDGRICFRGDDSVLAQANINLRCAERVLILLKSFEADTFDELFDGVYAIDWAEIMPEDAQFPVKGSSLSSTLSSVPACQSIVKKAIVEKMRAGHNTSCLPEDGALYKIRFSIRKNHVEVMLDTSGDGLHKRGYRRQSNLAPLKETLAATIVDLARLRRGSVVQDPFCGSGTLIIEAAQKAMHMAPGLRRRFLAEQYSFVPKNVWGQAREKALSEIVKDIDFKGIGFDIDPFAVSVANNNAVLAGVDDKVKFFVADVKDFAPAQSTIVMTNPPYGERLETPEIAAELEKMLSARLTENPVSGLYVITADADFESNFGKKATKRRKLYNGMIPCQVYMYF